MVTNTLNCVRCSVSATSDKQYFDECVYHYMKTPGRGDARAARVWLFQCLGVKQLGLAAAVVDRLWNQIPVY